MLQNFWFFSKSESFFEVRLSEAIIRLWLGDLRFIHTWLKTYFSERNWRENTASEEFSCIFISNRVLRPQIPFECIVRTIHTVTQCEIFGNLLSKFFLIFVKSMHLALIYTMCFFHEIFSNESKLLVFFPRTFHSSNIIGTHCIKVFKDRSKWEKFEFKRLFSWIIALLVINFEIVPQV